MTNQSHSALRLDENLDFGAYNPPPPPLKKAHEHMYDYDYV